MQNEKNPISEFAIASLVIGILSFISLAGMEKAILAIVFGALALKRMREDNVSFGKKLAKAGIILGIFSIILTINFIIKYYPKFERIIKNIQNENSLKQQGETLNKAYETEGLPDTRNF